MEGIKQAFSWDNGGIWMWIICAVSVICLALLVERVYYIFFKFNTNAKQFMDTVQRNIVSNNIDGAIQVCNAAGTAAVAQVIKAGLARANKTELEIQNAIEEAQLEISPLITRFLPALASLANIATLLGLLGTIIGLIQAFAALEQAAPDERQEKLSAGIAIAMNTTAFGLIVAIPTLTLHVLLSTFAKKILDDIELYSTKLGNLLAQRVK
ncbi:MAG: MotA/TolQ/ExbB proton channel family protein [Proteobacteria bacterium]|jgi:biopolymer transport protein ExbB/TolQ|nr:MotA/TolQ/ExbB proton channel family protein [Pseudomonadota bacterium]